MTDEKLPLSPEETLKRFRKWLINEMSSEDVEYAYVIDLVNGSLYHIEQFGECAPNKPSKKQMNIMRNALHNSKKSYIGRCD